MYIVYLEQIQERYLALAGGNRWAEEPASLLNRPTDETIEIVFSFSIFDVVKHSLKKKKGKKEKRRHRFRHNACRGASRVPQVVSTRGFRVVGRIFSRRFKYSGFRRGRQRAPVARHSMLLFGFVFVVDLLL